jgi:mannose-6-phosphate isomerase-like protein (cupin superfamily)
MSDYTIINLEDVPDSAPSSGLTFAEVRFPTELAGAEHTGFAHQRYYPNERQPFGHRHGEAEEVYFVIAGSGRAKLDGEVRELAANDILRIAPQVTRSFAAGPDGMELIVFGARRRGDGELVPDYWEH